MNLITRCLLTLFCASQAFAQWTETNGISYYPDSSLSNDYQRVRCKLDLRYPTKKAGFPTVVWFHGGGLSGGNKHWISFEDNGVAVATVNYRLHPRASHPAYLQDAAAAVAWVFQHIETFGGDPEKIFVAGHSAGGYLSAMISMDPRWLAPHGIPIQRIAGVIPVSGQVTTHFLVKKLRGDKGPQYRPLIDTFAPLYYASKDVPPICLILGDRKIEFPCRVEENELLAISLKRLGHPHVEFYEMGGLDHGTVVKGGMILLKQFVHRVLKRKTATK